MPTEWDACDFEVLPEYASPMGFSFLAKQGSHLLAPLTTAVLALREDSANGLEKIKVMVAVVRCCWKSGNQLGVRTYTCA